MDCNKADAARAAKKIAEDLFLSGDFNGAKEYALRAQYWFPGLERINRLLAKLDVYISARNPTNGEADLYGTLGVDPLADDKMLKKHRDKLALMLHPDKNKSIGADEALGHVSEAYRSLSDKTTRAEYDKRMNAKRLQKVSTPTGGSSAPPGANDFCNSAKSTTSNVRAHKNTCWAGHSSASASSHKQKLRTVCSQCKMHKECFIDSLSHHPLCLHCLGPFCTTETAPPPSYSSNSSNPRNSSQRQQSANHQASGKSTSNSGRNNVASPNVGVGGFSSSYSHKQTNFQRGPFSRTAGASSSTQAAKMARSPRSPHQKVKREHEEAQATRKGQEAMKRKDHVSEEIGAASTGAHSNSMKREHEEAQATRKGQEAMKRKDHVSEEMGAASTGAHSNSMKREHEEAQATRKGQEVMKRKDHVSEEMGNSMKRRKCIDNVGTGNSGKDAANQTDLASGVTNLSGSKPAKSETLKVTGTTKPSSGRDVSKSEIQDIMMQEAKMETRKKLKEGKWIGVENHAFKGEEIRNGKSNEKGDCDMHDQNKSGVAEDKKNGSAATRSFLSPSDAKTDAKTSGKWSMNVPDSDFFDFDEEGTERSFGDNQVLIPREESFRFSRPAPTSDLPTGQVELDAAATPQEHLQIITDAKEEIPEENVEKENGQEMTGKTASKRAACRTGERFEKNISKGCAVPKTTAKKRKHYLVYTVLLGFFILAGIVLYGIFFGYCN